MKKLPKKKKGQALVEMAILFPFFLLVIVGGIIDFGFAFFNFLSLQQLCNDAALYAAEGNGKIGIPSKGAIESFVASKKPVWMTNPVIVQKYEEVPIDGGAAKVKRVFLSYNSPMYTPFYQTMFRAITGDASLKLTVMAAYQIPKVVANR